MNYVAKKVLISYSAGIDSTTLAYWYKNLGYEVTLAVFEYNNGESKYLTSGKWNEEFLFYQDWHCNHAGFKKVVLRYPSLDQLTVRPNFLLPADNEAAAKAEKANLEFYAGFKLLMGMILLSHGAAYGYECVAFGHMPFNKHYLDSSKEAFDKLHALMEFAYGSRVVIPRFEQLFYSEFKTKAEVIYLAHKLGVPLRYTWSCEDAPRLTDGRYGQCGKCVGCIERKKGFYGLTMVDPALTN